MNPSHARRQALFALLALVLVWAYSWIVMKQVLRYAGPFDFAALRYLGGAAVLFAVLAIQRKSLHPPPLLLTVLIGLTQTTGFQALAQLALTSGGAGHVSLLAYTMPFWVVLIAWLLLSERPTSRQWLGLALAAAGLLFVLEPWNGLGSLHSALLAVGGGICWALGTVLSKRMFERHAPGPLVFTAWQMLIGALALGVVALLVPSRTIDWTPAFIAGLTYSVVMASSLAWLLWLFVVQRLPTTVAGLSSLAVPVTAVLMAWVILHERPDLWESIGIALIACGLLAVSGIGKKRDAAAADA
ncbi:EamA family transporter [Oleiagrimonas sp.]|jgi:drug/metabolite transporter (DMT)-like permease|uniref:DMT family transporter n=1 Tax=Oleiagrimonas sp. TaxID=2010330 RepID=UPI002622EC16|nr:EamA family transporter [Oleiagrimonas sp.]MDA3915136.1 EamA family transporter [Oleiagrimonas sp.]